MLTTEASAPRIMSRAALPLVLALLLATTASAGFAQAPRVWTVSPEPLVTIGTVEGDAAYLLDRVSDLLRLSDGRIVVANEGSLDVRFYDAAGRHQRTVGRRGRGPGEFEDISGVHAVGRDSLYVFDQNLARVSIFRSNGDYVDSFQLSATGDRIRPVGMYRLAGVLDNRDLVLVANAFPANMKPAPTLHFDSLPTLLYRRDGVLIGDVGEPVGMDMYATSQRTGSVSFGRVSSAFVDGKLLYITDGGRLEVRVYDPRRGLVRTVAADRAPRPVTSADINRLIDYRVSRVAEERRAEIRRHFEEWPRAQHKPSIARLLVDESGHLWAEQYEPWWVHDARTWEVFDRAGRHSGSVRMPSRMQVHQIGADYVLGVWRDEFEVEHVRVHRLRRQ